MNLEEDIKCAICKEILLDPVSLNCCGENVCKKHIDEILSKQPKNDMLCPICNSDIQNQKFHINKAMKSLIERELHKIKIDPEHQNVLKSFKEKIKTIESMNSDPENFIYEEFAELKRLVDLDRENAIKEINELADDLINKLKSYENQFKESIKSDSNLVDSKSLVEKMKKELDEYEKCLKSLVNTENDRKMKSEEVQKSNQLLTREIENFKYKLFENKSIAYEPMTGELKKNFGKLTIKNKKVDNESIQLLEKGSDTNVQDTNLICENHPHQFMLGKMNSVWRCDGGIIYGKCKRGFDQFFKTPGQTRFKCTFCKDFDLCDECFKAPKLEKN
jgi:DNA repair exonuclease SbcCD ATPase subunit